MGYEVSRTSNLFKLFCALPEREIRPGVTATFTSLVDLTEVEEIRNNETMDDGGKHSYTAFVVKALAVAMREFPYSRRRVFRQPWRPFRGPQLQAFDACDVGVAVECDLAEAESAAFVDVLRDADRADLNSTTQWLKQLAVSEPSENEQWRTMQNIARLPLWISTLVVRLPIWFPHLWFKYRGGPALVSSPAKYGVDHVSAAWNWPLGVSFGYVRERPIVYQGETVARRTFNLVLNFDRRVMAGAQAARFFKRMVDILENADTELAPFLARDQESRSQTNPLESPVLTATK